MAGEQLENVLRHEFTVRVRPLFGTACTNREWSFFTPGEDCIVDVDPYHPTTFDARLQSLGKTVARLTATYAAGGNVEVSADPGTKQTFPLAALTPGMVGSIVDGWAAAIKASR